MEKSIDLRGSSRSAFVAAAPVLALLGGMLLGMGVIDGPVCGVHTIRADDTALSMIREAGCSFVVQLLDWSQACHSPLEEKKGRP